MISIGIITVPKKKPTLYDRIFCKIKFTEEFGDNPRYIVVSIPVAKDNLSEMNNKRFKRIENKAKKLLSKFGAENVLYSEECQIALRKNKSVNFEFPKSSDIPIHRLCDCFFKFFSPVSDIYQSKRLCIIDSDFDFVNFDIIEHLCKSVKFISVFCKTPEFGKIISDKIFTKYGLWVDFFEPDAYNSKKPPFLLINADKRLVRIGDRIVCGAEFVSKSMQYRLNPAEEAYILGEKNYMDISNYF